MTQHTDLIERLRWIGDGVANEAATALEAQAREIAALKTQEAELCTLYGLAQAECKKLRKDAALVAARERERVAAWIEPQRNDVPATGYEFALAIRALNTEGDGHGRP